MKVSEQAVIQNLKDAGCDIQTTENCMSFVKAGNLKGMLPILQQYRKALLLSLIHIYSHCRIIR